MAKQKKASPPEYLAFSDRPLLGAAGTAAFTALFAVAALAAYRANHLPFLSPSYWLTCAPPVWRMSAVSARRHLEHLAWLGAFAGLSLAVGRGLLRKALRVEGLNRFEALSFAFGLGLGTVALATFVLGALHVLTPSLVFATATALAVLALWLNLGPRAEYADGGSVVPDAACRALAAVTFLLLAFTGFHALAPEISFDALVYHLALPGLYRLRGGLTATPSVVYSGFPMLLEWAYAFMLFFSDEISAKLIHWACAAGVAAAFVGIGARAKRPLAGWVACVVFLGMSITLYNVAKAAVDVGASYFTLLATMSLALHLSRRAEAPDSTGLLTLSALLCGLALGVKYTTWPLLPLFLVILWALGEPKRNLLRYGLVASAVLAPWLLKNVALYRNPVFPFLQEVFDPRSAFPSAVQRLRADAWGRDWRAILASGRALMDFLLHPWTISTRGATEFDSVGPVFLIGTAGLLRTRPAAGESRLWMWTILGLGLCWWTTSAMPRFFLPGLCLLSVYVGVLVARLQNRWVLFAALALITGLAFDAASDFSAAAAQTGNAAYLLDGATKEEYLRHTHRVYPASYFNAAEWLNNHAPADARVVLLNGGRGYYVNRVFVTSSPLDEDKLARWLKRSASAEELLAAFRQHDATYLLVNMAWLWGVDTDPAVTSAQRRILREFLTKYARLRFEDVDKNPEDLRWTLVYEIGPALENAPAAVSPLLQWYRTEGHSGLASHGLRDAD